MRYPAIWNKILCNNQCSKRTPLITGTTFFLQTLQTSPMSRTHQNPCFYRWIGKFFAHEMKSDRKCLAFEHWWLLKPPHQWAKQISKSPLSDSHTTAKRKLQCLNAYRSEFSNYPSWRNPNHIKFSRFSYAYITCHSSLYVGTSSARGRLPMMTYFRSVPHTRQPWSHYWRLQIIYKAIWITSSCYLFKNEFRILVFSCKSYLFINV